MSYTPLESISELNIHPDNDIQNSGCSCYSCFKQSLLCGYLREWLKVLSYPQKSQFREMGQVVVGNKKLTFLSLKGVLSLIFLSLPITNLTGCIHNFDTPCIYLATRFHFVHSLKNVVTEES